MSSTHKKVNNIIEENSRITFILESPHKDELYKGFPLAGKAGIKVSQYLFSDNKFSFGSKVKHGDLKGKVSILNVSTSPLQKSAYAYADENDCPKDIEAYERLKTLVDRGNKESYSTHRESKINTIKYKIYNNFFGELQKLPNNSFIIPCGKFARIFYTEAKKDERIASKYFTTIDINIPHPSSRKRWSKAMVDKIKEKLDLE